MKMIWERLDLSRDEWFTLARAFYDLAHGDRKEFNGLPPELMAHPVARLCDEYTRSEDWSILDEAGRMLTGSRQWHVSLGRTF